MDYARSRAITYTTPPNKEVRNVEYRGFTCVPVRAHHLLERRLDRLYLSVPRRSDQSCVSVRSGWSFESAIRATLCFIHGVSAATPTTVVSPYDRSHSQLRRLTHEPSEHTNNRGHTTVDTSLIEARRTAWEHFVSDVRRTLAGAEITFTNATHIVVLANPQHSVHHKTNVYP